jgi:orotidine-5'-phosphate decarboxylase
MNEREEAALIVALDPMAEALKQSFIKALVLRVTVHIQAALNNGAEQDDVPELLVRAIDSSTPITKRYLDEIGDVKLAKEIIHERRN